jgi:hypothetical protein
MLSRKAWMSARLLNVSQLNAHYKLGGQVQDCDMDSCLEKVCDFGHGDEVSCRDVSLGIKEGYTAMRRASRRSAPVQLEIALLEDVEHELVAIMLV